MNHPVYYKSFEDELQAFISENWARWEREKPKWFTDAWKANCPPHMKPKSAQTPRLTLQQVMRLSLRSDFGNGGFGDDDDKEEE